MASKPEPITSNSENESSPRENNIRDSLSEENISYTDYKAHEVLQSSLSELTLSTQHKDDMNRSGPLTLSGPLDLSKLSGKLSRSGSIEFDHSRPLSLDTLPPELLLTVCDYLDAKFVINILSLVCRYFHEVIQDDITWKIRIAKTFPGKIYPCINVDDDHFNWKNACIEREEKYQLWSGHERNMQHFSFSKGLYASVDSVHLMKEATLLASGSRDRYLNLWDLTQLDDNDPKATGQCNVQSKMDAHKGWIWSLYSLDNSLCTGSWDMWMKFWDVNVGLVETGKVKCNSAILSLSYDQDCVMAGGFNQKVYFIDPRTHQIIKIKKLHKKAVLCLAADDKYMITGSEDHKVCVYDRRADQVFKTLTLDNYPMSMSYGDGQLWIGDKTGCLHLFDASHGEFGLLESNLDIGHTGKLTGLHHSWGSVITCSTDKSIKVMAPTLDPNEITTLKTHKAEVAGIDYRNKVLASACSDASIGIWRPMQLDHN